MSYVVVSKASRKQNFKKWAKRLIWLVVLLIFAVIFVAIYTYWHAMTPTIIDIAQTKVSSQTLLAVNQAVFGVLAEEVNLDSLISVERDANGRVVLLRANTQQVNVIARKMAILSQSKIDLMAKDDIDIPLGTISGMPLLMEKGPSVTITVTPIGAVNCTFTSSFESAGVNQTLHRIYINVQCKVDLVIPTTHYVVENNIPILISESVIVGNVPQTYLNGGLILGGYGQID